MPAISQWYKIKKSYLYTRIITPKHVTSGEAHLRDFAPGQHSFEETSQQWRDVGVSDMTDMVIQPQTSRHDSDVFRHFGLWHWLIAISLALAYSFGIGF